MAYNRKDSYYFKAKQEGYKSRAAYKLLELHKKYNIIRKGAKILDCGAAPGGWCQVALQLVGSSGIVVAVDYAPIDGITDSNFKFIKGDMYSAATLEQIQQSTGGQLFDVVLSDMAPKTTGIKVKDHADSIELANIALDMARKHLKNGGTFLVKLFDGEDRTAYVKSLESVFKQVRMIRPDATRKSSYEMYVIASNKLALS